MEEQRGVLLSIVSIGLVEELVFCVSDSVATQLPKVNIQITANNVAINFFIKQPSDK